MHKLPVVRVFLFLSLGCELLLSASLTCATPFNHRSARLRWSNEYLSYLGTFNPKIDESFALNLAGKAKIYGKRETRGKCLQGVRIALYRASKASDSLLNSADVLRNLDRLPNDPANKRQYRPARSAEDFKNWALENPDSLCQILGLEVLEQSYKLRLSPGMILIYGKGRCGFHPRYGHIEIVTDSFRKEACSDHCRPILCRPEVVLAPTRSCLRASKILSNHYSS